MKTEQLTLKALHHAEYLRQCEYIDKGKPVPRLLTNLIKTLLQANNLDEWGNKQ